MTTSQAKIEFLKYSHTIGLSTMEGRGFYYPVDTAVGENGRLYTVSRSLDGDPRGLRVTVYDLDSEYYGTFGSFGDGDGQFIWPTAIACDSQGNTYIADEYTNRVNVFDASWKHLDKWGVPGAREGELDGPSGLAFDCEDNLYVVDHHNNRVQKFTKDGRFLSSFGSQGAEDGQFSLPWGITIGDDGSIYVADWRNDRIQKFSSDGQFIARYGTPGRGDGQFHRPASVAVDSEGYIYMADWGNERVQILDPDGGFVMKLRGEATDSRWAQDFLSINMEEAAARASANLELELEFFNDDPHEESSHIEKYFWAPTSVKLDSEGRLYVTESNRHRVQIYQRMP
jgi:tripartite motif-containing protein 71